MLGDDDRDVLVTVVDMEEEKEGRGEMIELNRVHLWARLKRKSTPSPPDVSVNAGRVFKSFLVFSFSSSSISSRRNS